MTGLPAARFGLGERGLIREGCFADLVLFDPKSVRDIATYDDPVQPSEGIVRVWINGVLSYGNGVPSECRAGRFVKRSATVTNQEPVALR